MLNEATCSNCGWVHYTIGRNLANDHVKSFNLYLEKLSPEERQEFYGDKKSHISDYEHCHNCGAHYKTFRDTKFNDCPDGCTIQPIIHRNE